MPLGDSLTAFSESYRGPLYRTFLSEGTNVDFVGSMNWEPAGGGDPDGEGHGGFRIGPDSSLDSDGKRANLDAWIETWLGAAKPNVILLGIGTNDLAEGGQTALNAPAKLRRLVARIRILAPSAYIVVGDVPPIGNHPDGWPEQAAVNASARSIGSAGDPKVTYGDNNKRLAALGFNVAQHTTDGVHFTVSGGELQAKAWYPTARAAIRAACGL